MSDMPEHSEVNIREVLRMLWGSRWTIVAITLFTAVCAGIAAFLVPKKYEASVVVSPVASTSSGQLGGLSAMTSQLGGLAALAGISVGSDSKKSESIAILQSEALTADYIRSNDLLPVLYERKWDAARKDWKDKDPDQIPTLWKANQYFKKTIRKIKTDNKSGLVTMTITWRDPALAAKWANDLVLIANDYLRTKAIEESERNIAYLNAEAAKTNIVEARQAIYSILQTEINRAMLARGSEEYAFKVIDPATQPEKASSPQKRLWAALGVFAGAFLSVLFVLARKALAG